MTETFYLDKLYSYIYVYRSHALDNCINQITENNSCGLCCGAETWRPKCEALISIELTDEILKRLALGFDFTDTELRNLIHEFIQLRNNKERYNYTEEEAKGDCSKYGITCIRWIFVAKELEKYILEHLKEFE